MTCFQVGSLYSVSTKGTDVGAFPGYGNGALPRGITVGPDGNLWYTDQGRNKIVRAVLPSGYTEFSVPTATASPYDIVSGPGGYLWFTELTGNKIGRITTNGTQIDEFPIPAGVSAPQPSGIAVGPDGNLWFLENNGNRVDRITPAGVITPYTVPTINAFLEHIVAGPDGNLWFTEGGGNKIGRITP